MACISVASQIARDAIDKYGQPTATAPTSTATAAATAMAKVTNTNDTERPAKKRRMEGTHCIVD